MDELIVVSERTTDRWASRQARARTFLRERGIGGLITGVRTAGARGSVAFIIRQLHYSLCIFLGRRWDHKHGVETGGQIEVENLDIVGPNANMGYPAVSTSPSTFAYLSRFFPRDRSDCTFVDLGCAKGRALLLASRFGFDRVIGVEFAASLCDIACQNIARFPLTEDARRRCTVVHADATKFELPDERLVLYFNNPFGLELWPAMLANISKSARRNPRCIRILLTGSIEAPIRRAGELIMNDGAFGRIGQGTAPYFFDTYLPYHYEVFETL